MKILASAVSLCLATSLVAADTASLRKAPELAIDVPNQGQKLLSSYRGKVVALEFIFTTCPHCQAFSRMMTKVQQDYGPRGLQVLAVAINENADLLVENFVKDYQVNFPVGWAPRDQMLAFMGYTSARFVVPQLALIDRQGVIHYQTTALETDQWKQIMNEQSIRQHIEELLSESGSNSTKVAASRKAPQR